MPTPTLARFIAFHDLPESRQATLGRLHFAVTLARSPGGMVLVFNLWRRVWELPGGLIDNGEDARDSAARELYEEAGCTAGPLRWLGVAEVNDGTRYLGAVFGCDVDGVSDGYTSDETGGVALWTPERAPTPLGLTDTALLHRFG